jgi:NAD(P)-dependent dehydrogenase (short-subunit alcohol dehydrogenase family)
MKEKIMDSDGRIWYPPFIKPVAVITGSQSGLGKAIAEEMSAQNFIVCGLDRDKSVSEDVNWRTYKCDVRIKEDIYDASISIFQDFGPIDILINCAGINYICPFKDLEKSDFNNLINSNVGSILLTSQIFLQDLIVNKGTILNIISNASHMPMTHSFAYNASKGAAEIATKQMARELTKEHGITVFGISPNKLKGTKMSRYIEKTFPTLRGMTYEEGIEYQKKSLLTGKETEPEQIAKIVAFLLRNKWQHEFLSGCVLPMGL